MTGEIRSVFTDARHGDLMVRTDPDVLAARRAAIADRPWSWLRQVRGARVVTVAEPGQHAGEEADAAVTAVPGAVLAVQTADCAPVLIADPVARVVASAHAGWKGALGGVVASAVEAMVDLGASRDRMVAAVGPCIGPDSYEVGVDFLERFEAGSPGAGRFFRPGAADDKRLFDLPGFVLSRLAEAGVERAEWTGQDTCDDEANFYSNRRAVKRGETDYGRLLSAIMLADE